MLTRITPDDFGDADQRQDRAVDRPVIVTDHEADAEGQVHALEHPDRPRQDHQDADQAADDPHHDIKC